MARPRKPINQQKGHLTKEYQEQRKLEEALSSSLILKFINLLIG